MVSLWPWKGEDNSPASFEKALSTLSKKITQTTARLDSQRKRARRFKALWTLYTTFAYLTYSLILGLGVGWQKWGVVEYAAVILGPAVIYAVRAIASRGFEYQVSKTEKYLVDLNKQRQETIEKLKVATKYNSTQQLLEKYGGETSPKPTPQKSNKADFERKENERRGPGTPQQVPGRTGIPPPPTANIRHRQDVPGASSPIQSPQPVPGDGPGFQSPAGNIGGRKSFSGQNLYSALEEPGFAPNAFPAPPQYSEPQHRWYDRLLDVLLGEDETLPRNRLVLICQNCRLVNGQAPPGVKTLEEIGRWRCASCGAWNGEESDAKKMLANITKSQSVRTEPETTETPSHISVSNDEDITSDDAVVVGRKGDLSGSESEGQPELEPEPEADEEPEEDPEPPTTKNKRGRPKGSKKKG